jgi:hypothetical protein
MNNEERHRTPRSDGIYVASRVVRAPVWKAYRERGIPIVSTWIDEAGDGETGDFGELWQRIRTEIQRSRALVFYAAGVQDFPFKGALVEIGMALAMGKRVYAFLDDVMLDGRTMRPAGSWVLDRNVALCDSLDEAIDRALHETLALSEKEPIAAAAYVLAIQQSVGSILSQYAANKILDRAKEIANGH